MRQISQTKAEEGISQQDIEARPDERIEGRPEEELRVREVEEAREAQETRQKEIVSKVEKAGLKTDNIKLKRSGSVQINLNESIDEGKAQQIQDIARDSGAEQVIFYEQLPEGTPTTIQLNEETKVGNTTIPKGAVVDNVYQTLEDGSVTTPLYQLSFNRELTNEEVSQKEGVLIEKGIEDYAIDKKSN